MTAEGAVGRPAAPYVHIPVAKGREEALFP